LLGSSSPPSFLVKIRPPVPHLLRGASKLDNHSAPPPGRPLLSFALIRGAFDLPLSEFSIKQAEIFATVLRSPHRCALFFRFGSSHVDFYAFQTVPCRFLVNKGLPGPTPHLNTFVLLTRPSSLRLSLFSLLLNLLRISLSEDPRDCSTGFLRGSSSTVSLGID